MANVIRQNQRTFYLESFVKRFVVDNDNLYIGIGRTASWPNDAAPPQPDNSTLERQNFFTDLIAIQKVANIDISPVLRRIDWETGVEYDLFDDASDAAFQSNFYVRNSENRVYMVVSKTPSAVTGASEPLGLGDNINTGDGYTWKYMYTITAALQGLISASWYPVPAFNTIGAEQVSDGDIDAYGTMGANHCIVKSNVNDPLISDSITYRQVALIVNPTDNSDVLITAGAELAANIKDSGRLLQIENRTPITRSSGQQESYLTIFRVY